MVSVAFIIRIEFHQIIWKIAFRDIVIIVSYPGKDFSSMDLGTEYAMTLKDRGITIPS